MRYLIASLLNSSSGQLIRQTYQDAFNRPCRVKTLHLTFIPPFTTPSPDRLLPIPQLNQLEYQTCPPQTFNHRRQILYLPLTPVAPLSAYFRLLLPQIRPHITFASTDFPPDTIPDFLPHITLDYDFNYPLHWSLPEVTITLIQPQLLFETAPGTWKPYAV